MQKFVKRLFLFGAITFSIAEIGSRIFIDPLYFHLINPYRSPSSLSELTLTSLLEPETNHLNYLFIGSSMAAASIDPTVFNNEANSHSLNVGRGYMTGGIHYFALQNMITKHPDLLRGSTVFIELQGGVNYNKSFSEHKFDTSESMSHLLLPHINFDQLIGFLKSHHSMHSKTKFTLSYCLASYRAYPFIKEYKTRFFNKVTNYFSERQKDIITNSGAIKNKTEEVIFTQKIATAIAERKIRQQKNERPITDEQLNHSIMNKFHDLITSNGGKMVLFELPLHSSQALIYETALAKTNKRVFAEWAKEKNIPILAVSGLEFTDGDFPDFLHLSINRRNEFSEKLLTTYQDITQ